MQKYFIEIKTSSWYNGFLDIKCTPLISQSLIWCKRSYFYKDHTLICKQQTHLYMYWHGSYLWRNKANLFLPTCYACPLNNILSFTSDTFWLQCTYLLHPLWSQSFQFRCFVSGHNWILELGCGISPKDMLL